MASNRTQLLSLSQESGKTFKEYAQKWRELVARVQPPMVEREMIDMFTSTLSGHYYVACSTSASFAKMVRYGERIESGLKSGKIQYSEGGSSSSVKKAYNGHPKKEKGEANTVYSGRSKAQVNTMTISASQSQAQQAPRQQNQRQQENHTPRRFDVVPMSYADLFARLNDLKLVVPKPAFASSPPDKRPRNYDANASCEFHSGTLGHNIENCYAFKCKVQDLIDSKTIELEARPQAAGPNVTQNPMPRHGVVQAVMEDGEVLNLIMDVDFVKTPLPFVKEYLIKRGVFPGCEAGCERCEHCSNGCVNLKDGIQYLIDDGQLQFDRIRKDKKVETRGVFIL